MLPLFSIVAEVGAPLNSSIPIDFSALFVSFTSPDVGIGETRALLISTVSEDVSVSFISLRGRTFVKL